MTFHIGDTVFWQHTEHHRRKGIVEDIDGTIGVRFQTGELVYIEAEKLQRGTAGGL